ncbi:MAG: EAL domain-containing protein [Sulfurimonas sp.]|nr:EAL domain-containing protein [Sulfurimonas sp.]
MVNKKEVFLFLLLFSLGIFFIFIYLYIKQAEKDIFTKIEINRIEQISYLFQNIEKDIIDNNKIKNSKQLIKLLYNAKTRKKYEKYLSFIATPSIKYIYLLTKDNKGRFRFLLDASKIDKANFFEKFDVTNQKYKALYITKEAQIIRQEDMENLFLTYIYPIKVDEQIIAVLSVDITTKIKQTLIELTKPLETFFIILVIFVFLFVAMTIIQVFHYFITRKKIFTDPLTQLYNRNYLAEVSPMLKLENYSVAMLDLDKFKVINDTYGHKAGDFILAQSAQILKNSTRGSDILIRYGGEEFLLFIYKRDNDNNSTLKICERIRKNIDTNKFIYDYNEIQVQVSIGIHEHPHLEKNLNEAIKIADKMLYIAKTKGRNRVINYIDSKKDTHVKSNNLDFVKDAIDDNRVVCFYQPIYNYLDKTILKYEALVRIIDKHGEIISPIFLLEDLKHTNIHYKLTQRILFIIFEKFKNIDKHVGINLNFSDLINEDIEKTILDAFKKNPNLASRVTIEILESDEIKNIPLFKEKIELMHSYGAQVSIDDFGSGYSNFKTILDIEANFLKIDGSLIKNIDINEKDFKVVKSIIHFAKVANMKTIAEFVHSQEVYDKLLPLDLDYMQGYYIAEPSPTLLNVKDLF